MGSEPHWEAILNFQKKFDTSDFTRFLSDFTWISKWIYMILYMILNDLWNEFLPHLPGYIVDSKKYDMTEKMLETTFVSYFHEHVKNLFQRIDTF